MAICCPVPFFNWCLALSLLGVMTEELPEGSSPVATPYFPFKSDKNSRFVIQFKGDIYMDGERLKLAMDTVLSGRSLDGVHLEEAGEKTLHLEAPMGKLHGKCIVV